MILTMTRTEFTAESTISSLLIAGVHQCFVLEDTCREDVPGTWAPSMKIAGKTAIAYGRFEIVMTFSDRFQRVLPLLLRVPDYEGIRIHPGNKAVDTEGCLLPGQSKAPNWVGQSKVAFDALYRRISIALKKEKVWIDITKSEVR